MSATLGEAGVPHDDASYTGETGDSVVSQQYARNKITEFQQTLQALDAGYQSAVAALQVPGLDGDTADYLRGWIDDFEGKRWVLKTTAEAINLGAAAYNAAGGRMPSLSIPGTLGFLPALSVPMIVALGTAATLIAWGTTALNGLHDRLKYAQSLNAQLTPESKAELARSVVGVEAARGIAGGTGLSALVPVFKWGAIGLLGFFAIRALVSGRAQNPALEYVDEEDPEEDADY